MKHTLLALLTALVFTPPLQAQESTPSLLTCDITTKLVDEIMQMDPQPSEVRSICALDENNEATVVASLTDEETEDGKNYVIELHLLQ
jgi:hypothetical protein